MYALFMHRDFMRQCMNTPFQEGHMYTLAPQVKTGLFKDGRLKLKMQSLVWFYRSFWPLKRHQYIFLSTSLSLSHTHTHKSILFNLFHCIELFLQFLKQCQSMRVIHQHSLLVVVCILESIHSHTHECDPPCYCSVAPHIINTQKLHVIHVL